MDCRGGGNGQRCWSKAKRGDIGGCELCMRVLTMSSGCTTSVATDPAVRPAMDSTWAGERPACWEAIMEDSWALHGWGWETPIASGCGCVEGGSLLSAGLLVWLQMCMLTAELGFFWA